MEFPQLYPAPLVSLLLCNLSSHSEAILQMEHLPLASNTGNHSFSTYFCPQSIQRLQWELRTGILLIEPLPGNHLSWGTLILPRWCRWRGCSSSGTRGSILCRVLVITDQELLPVRKQEHSFTWCNIWRGLHLFCIAEQNHFFPSFYSPDDILLRQWRLIWFMDPGRNSSYLPAS